MSRRRASHSESLGLSSAMNESLAYPFSGMQQNSNAPLRRGPIEGPNGRRLIRRVTWRSSTYKLMACLWVLGVFYIVWLIRDLLIRTRLAHSLLASYVGRQECGISSLSLYNPPQSADESYCESREALLDAMSSGGRHGFDAAYTSQGCSYRWFTSAEVCDILRKFDGIVFIGDDTLADAYAGFNILLREDLATGSLKEWEIKKDQGQYCRCDSQFTSPACLPLRIVSSDQLSAANGGKPAHRPYTCPSRVPHAFLPIAGSPAPKSAYERFRRIVTRAAGRNKPVPVILSVSLSTSYSLSTAKSSMDEWLTLVQSSGRNAPFLWVGPTAPGLQQDSGDNIHATSWQYSQDSIQEAHTRGMEALGMYNATLQADSWDGKRYGEKVALMEAMMILNWLSTL
ncbi:hypothetical protein BO70DRAFT_373511 [Aspergillus heteromorphus CBS 117.55]|uniref:Uncharacterized protein n=1 Tax=Aspergillus heteromorphus CBS 117.55 TaxID=1448321 RepID=A0A317VEV5_9EURO|nr:uncharacterized protein BO70DRAFT_373511 [Aspergillus heteromorphus CBS 117.55]PWY71627.1 hypothetical protein BO70DRAFT_373511 [Aspergillus heteromorphus CBS 117.55]